MLLNEAIKIRLENIMKEKNINSKYELSCDAGINPSLLNDFLEIELYILELILFI